MHVLITGAAGGLGRALAVECARRGYRLFLTDRNAQALCHIQDGLCRQFGVQVTAVPCDLTDSASVDAMLDQIDRAQMQFDMLLNVAGLDYQSVEKPPGVRGPQPPEALIGFGDMRVKSAKSLA